MSRSADAWVDEEPIPPTGDPRDKVNCACPRLDGKACIRVRTGPTPYDLFSDQPPPYEAEGDEECECFCHDVCNVCGEDTRDCYCEGGPF